MTNRRCGAETMKILVADGLESEALATLRESHDVHAEELNPEELLRAIPTYHAIILRSRTKITKDVLRRATSLKVIGRAGIGVDNIDVDEATSRKIAIVNAPTASTISVAELALGHMLSLYRHLAEADRSVKEGKWEKKRFEGRELAGKTLGLLGSGRIGTEVAKRAQAFGMRVIAYDPYLTSPMAEDLGIRLVDKETLFAQADIVSVHAALTTETKGLVGPKDLGIMKRTAVLVNCARGEIVQEPALAEALRAGTIAGAAIDVFSGEPPAGNPLLSAPNVFFTPHLGASTHEAQARAGAIVAEQVLKVLKGKRPDFLVNPKVYG